jgi:transcriptional regulator NrdR family protein
MRGRSDLRAESGVGKIQVHGQSFPALAGGENRATRWKQITHERFNCAIFLATVDDRVSRQALDEMQSAGIGLVVPESLKTSKETFYSGHANVISFRNFFDDEIKTNRPALLKTQ